MSEKEKILEGKYNYYQADKVYTQENFTLSKDSSKSHHLYFNAEVLSRVRTGEFLKILVEYVVCPNFNPIKVEITRQLGEKESRETYMIDQKNKEYNYTFKSDSIKQTATRTIMLLPHIATPCFMTSSIMLNQKKLDLIQRTPYSLLSTPNTWEFESVFDEQELFLEMQGTSQKKIMLNGNEVSATHCKVINPGPSGASIEENQENYLSKYYFIPYKAIFSDNIKIVVDKLKYFKRPLK